MIFPSWCVWPSCTSTTQALINCRLWMGRNHSTFMTMNASSCNFGMLCLFKTRLTSLKVLELRDNNLQSLPKSFSRLVSLEKLDLGNNKFASWVSNLYFVCLICIADQLFYILEFTFSQLPCKTSMHLKSFHWTTTKLQSFQRLEWTGLVFHIICDQIMSW